MSEWKEYKLSEIMELIGGGTPKTTVSEYWDGSIPWLSVTDFNNEKKYCFDAEKKITERGLNESSTKILKKGQIIISARGTVGVLSVLGRDMSFNQSCYGIDAIGDITYNDFLYYLLENNIDIFHSVSYGAVFDTITKETFNQILVSIPPLPEQRVIASVLSSLDDKIDLLHRQNKTLEAMAETIFRQWFVEDFDRMEFEQLKLLVSVIDNRGKTPPYQNISTEYPVIEVNALVGDTRIVNYSVIRKYVLGETFKTWFRGHPKKFDILLSTVGSIGEISMFLIEKGSIAQNVVALSPSVISPFYLYQFLKFSQKQIMQLDIGGVQPSIKIPHLLSMLIPIPTKEKQKIFDGQLIKITSKMELNYKQIRTLEKIRDTLLPKLMSGKVRIEV